MLDLKEYRSNALGLPDLLNHAFLVGELPIAGKPAGVMLTKGGSLLAGFSYAGPDPESSSPRDLEILSATINHALARLGTGWCAHIDMIREPTSSYIAASESHFDDPVSLLIDQERQAQYRLEGAHFLTRYVAVFSYTLPSDSESRLARAMVTHTSKAERSLDEHARKFAGEVDNVAAVFAGYCRVAPLDSSALLSHIHGCISGDFHRLGVPRVPAFLDGVLGSHELLGGFRPAIDGKAIRVVHFDGFPAETTPTTLEALSVAPIPMRYSFRFQFLDPADASNRLTKIRLQWFQKRQSLWSHVSQTFGGNASSFANSDAIAMAQDADGAIAEASSGVLRYGYATPNVIIIDPDAEVADDRARQVAQVLNNLGFTARIEGANTVQAWLGSLPGHIYENVRRPMLHSLTVADLMPTTSVWAGSAHNPNPMYRDRETGRAAPPLMYAATTGNTPFRLSLHVDDLGHTLVAGPTGAGKSTLLALIAAQHRRYENARIFAFDKGLSMYALTLAVGGVHYEPGADSSTLSFAPLSRIDEGPAERAWAEDWIESLCVAQNVAVDAPRRQIVHQAIESLAQAESRSVTDFVNIVQDEEIRGAIEFYSLRGRAGRLLDAETDSLDLVGADFSTFEIDALMDPGRRLVAIPTLLYLFHRIERSLDGSPTLIILDEAWAMLDHPLFADKIREWLKVLRKANAAVIFATQSLADLRDNPLRPVLQESCPTKILLPNREAAADHIAPLYHDLGLNDWQIRLLQTSTPKHDYFIVSPEGRRRVSFGLGPVALAFAAASSKGDLARIRELAGQHGSRWVIEWLRERMPGDPGGWVAHAESLVLGSDSSGA